jgi:hypothetical protein
MLTDEVTIQPDERVLVIITLPGATPVRIPVVEPMVATEVLLLAQAPLPPLFVRVVELPRQTVFTPFITGIRTVALPWAPQQPAAERALK